MPDAEAPTPLAGVFPPRLVARLHRERFEGTLRLHGGGAVRVIYFRRGEIASAASNADDDRLPNILIREGRLTAPQVEMARAKQRPGVSLGKTLIELGFLTPAELLSGARRQVRQILAAAFALREGTSQESPGPLPPEVTVLGLPVRRLIFDALLEAGDRQTVVQEMGSMETVYRPSDELETALPTLRLEPQHEEVARLVDGHATLREISGRVRLDDLTVSKVVLALEILGLVRQETPRLGTGAGRRIPVIASEEPEEEPPLKVASESSPGGALPSAAFPEPEPPATAAAPFAPPPAASPPPFPAAAAGSETPMARFPEPARGEAPPTSFPAPGASAATPSAAWAPAAPVAARTPASVPYAPSWSGAAEDPDRADDEVVFEEEAETPPIPPGELPAFAAPPNAPTGWSVDPETGEKVHLGPIELTFDGPVVPPQQHGVGRGRLALFGAAGLLAVAAVFAWFIFRGDGSRDSRVQSGGEIASRAAGTGAPAAGSESPAAVAEPPRDEGKTAAEPPRDAGTTTPPRETAQPPRQDTGSPAGPEPDPPSRQETVPSPREETVPPPRQENAPASPHSEPPADRTADGASADFGFGQRLLDAGTIDRAVEVFGRAVAPIPAGRYTLQTMIACEAETVRKARAGTRPDAGLFVLPIAVRGRGCYRVLWGVFETRAAAEAARSELPRYFVSAGVSPAVVPLDRLRSPS